MHPIRVIAIHGGDAFATYKDYLAYLTSATVDLTDGQRQGWRQRLQMLLGDAYAVTLPRMPNANNAKYVEWKLWFEKYIPLLPDDVILVGHSQGASFLAKYLAEERFPKKIHATFLIAPPYDTDGDRAVVEFVPPASLALLAEQGGEVFLYHSTDDFVVPFSEHGKYVEQLPSAHARVFADRGHFLQEDFPELIKDINGLRV